MPSTRSGKQTRGIHTFARVTKPTASSHAPPKAIQPSDCLPTALRKLTSLGKRKVGPCHGKEEDRQPPKKRANSATLCNENPQTLPTPEATPTNVRTYQPNQPVLPIKCDLSTTTGNVASRPGTLPLELKDLVHLNSALLRALALSLAHAGSETSIDIRLLIPSLTRIYVKRKVTQADVRRSIQLLNKSQREPVFRILDHGHERICIERFREQKKSTIMPRWVDEYALSEASEILLDEQWTSYLQRQNNGPDDDQQSSLIQSFISEMPLEPIALLPSLQKLQPYRESSQRRLEDLKGAAISTQRAKDTSTSLAKESKSSEGLQHRASSLLARLQARSTLASSQTSLSPEQREKTAALLRLDLVIPILSTTSAKAKGFRTSIPLSQMVRMIRESVGKPWGPEEVARSLHVLVEDVDTEGWVTIEQVGGEEGIKCLVIEETRKPVNIKSRVDSALQEARTPQRSSTT